MAKKKTRKTKAAANVPRLVALIPCDGTTRDPNMGKFTLYGIFDRITVESFPTDCAFSVYLKIAGLGKWDVRADLLDPKGNGTGTAPSSLTVDVESKDGKQVVLMGFPVRLKREGRHELVAIANDKHIGWKYDILVERRAKREA